MANRYNDWAIIYSPLDKSTLTEQKLNKLIKVLKKNSTLYSISYETGDMGQNPHWDIVTTFKTKQAKGDLVAKFHNILDNMERPCTVCTKITDIKQRLGYNLKENLDFPFSIDDTSNITDEYRQTCITYYEKWLKTQETNNKIKNTFKFIQTKNALHEINKFILLSGEENINTEAKLKIIITQMLLQGYYFDMKAITKRKMVKAYLAYTNNDTTTLKEELDEWFVDETNEYRCHNCQHINQI
jgi:hypothetical protein